MEYWIWPQKTDEAQWRRSSQPDLLITKNDNRFQVLY
jgi:hypothetical protein